MILKYTPQKKKLSEILKEFGPNPALADWVAETSREMRKASMRKVDFDADYHCEAFFELAGFRMGPIPAPHPPGGLTGI